VRERRERRGGREEYGRMSEERSRCIVHSARPFKTYTQWLNLGNGGVIDRMTGQCELSSLKIATRYTRAPCHHPSPPLQYNLALRAQKNQIAIRNRTRAIFRQIMKGFTSRERCEIFRVYGILFGRNYAPTLNFVPVWKRTINNSVRAHALIRLRVEMLRNSARMSERTRAALIAGSSNGRPRGKGGEEDFFRDRVGMPAARGGARQGGGERERERKSDKVCVFSFVRASKS